MLRPIRVFLSGALFMAMTSMAVAADDGPPPVTVEQVPADRRATADPDVPRAKDADGCPTHDRRTADTTEDFYGLPVIRDGRENGERLIPGVNVRPSGAGRGCRTTATD